MSTSKTKRKLTEFVPDSRNANKGTERGLSMLEDSLRSNGAGRSILVDKQNRVIAGNKTLQSAVDIGLKEAIVIPTDGSQLVVVQRVDIDLDTPKGRSLAIADNRVAETDLEWDPDELQALMDDGIDLSKFWNDKELSALLKNLNSDGEGAGFDDIPEQWAILIECTDESQQTALLERLSNEGVKCRALIS